MAKVELKAPVVEEISGVIGDAASVVLVDHRGLTVAQDTELRRLLRAEGVTYKVYKNTMMVRAFQGTPCEELTKYLEGPSALAVSKDDATAAARVLVKFSKKAPALEVKAGIVEGTVYDAAGIMPIAEIPSRDELIAVRHTIDEICQLTGADTLGFLPPDKLCDMLGGHCTGFCDACFSGKYPTKIPEKMLAGKERGGVDFDKKLPLPKPDAACSGTES